MGEGGQGPIRTHTKSTQTEQTDRELTPLTHKHPGRILHLHRHARARPAPVPAPAQRICMD